MLLLILYLLFYIFLLGCRQAVRHQVLVLAFRGSNPCTPAIFFSFISVARSRAVR